MLQDVIRDIKSQADIVEVIKAIGVGAFKHYSTTGKFRGAHIACGSTNDTACVVDGANQWWRCFTCGNGGDVIKWVLHAKFEGEVSRYRDAVTWLSNYYGIEVSDSPLDVPRQDAQDLLTNLSWRWHERLMSSPEKLEWIHNRWGLTKDTVEALRLGYADGVSEAGYDMSRLRTAGLIDEKGNQPLNGRIIFPYFRDGLVVWMSGRIPYDNTDEMKYANLYKTAYVGPTLYNFDNAYRTSPDLPIVFTEGLADAARAYQEGIRAVAPGGAGLFTHDMYGDTITLLKHCKDAKYIIYDREDSGAGAKGARNLAQALITFGYDPFIVDLPRGDNDRGKMDLCDYLNQHGVALLAKLMESAVKGEEGSAPRTLPNILIDECPVNAETERVANVLKAIAPLSDFGVTKYIDALAKRTKSNVSDLKSLIKKVRERQAKITREIDYAYQKPPFLAQDFVYHKELDVWRAHTCVYVPYLETKTIGANQERVPVVRPVHVVVDMSPDGTYNLVKSDPLEDPPASIREMLPSRVVVQEEFNHWSLGPTRPYSFTNFVEGKTQPVNVAELYQRIYRLFDKYLWLPDERDKYLLALYPFLTHVYMGVESVPYLHITGKKDSGKSTLMEILGICCFNTAPSSSISPATLFRIAHGSRPTFIIDEAEKLKNPPLGSMEDELLRLCLGSYAKNEQARALRCGRDDLQPEAYNTYSPKILGSINELKDTLASRSILIHCMQPRIEELMKLSDWEADRAYAQSEFQEIRDQLRVWALTQFRTLREAFDGVERSRAAFLLTRDRQIWRPLIALADVVSEAWGFDVSAILMDLAKDKIEAKKSHAATNEFGNLIMIALHKLYKQDRNLIGYYYADKKKQDCISLSTAVSRIRDYLTKENLWDEQFNRLDARFLGRHLRLCNVIDPKVRSFSGKVHGETREVTPISFDVLTEYLTVKGLLNLDEDVENGSESHTNGARVG